MNCGFAFHADFSPCSMRSQCLAIVRPSMRCSTGQRQSSAREAARSRGRWQRQFMFGSFLRATAIAASCVPTPCHEADSAPKGLGQPRADAASATGAGAGLRRAAGRAAGDPAAVDSPHEPAGRAAGPADSPSARCRRRRCWRRANALDTTGGHVARDERSERMGAAAVRLHL